MTKKILFVGMSSNYGGLETFMMNIFRKLNSDSYNFEFIKDFSNGEIAYAKEIKNNGGVIRKVPILDKNNQHLFTKYVVRKRLVSNFFKNHHDYDVIHINTLNINGIIFWVKEAEKYGIKVIIHLHLDKLDNVIHGSGSKVSILKSIKSCISEVLTKINLRYINNDDSIIKLTASENSGNYFFGKGNFKIIDNGIDVEKYKFHIDDKIQVKNSLNINEDTKIIMTVARISRQKNYRKIIKIFQNIKKSNPKTKLVIVGGGECFDEIVEMVNNYGLKNDVDFLGIRKDVNKLLSSANLILMPSLLEAFPFVLLESQAAGVPGLVSRNVIPQGENITGELTYLSLKDNDQYWAKIANKILTYRYDQDKKISMYNCVKKSKYNLSYSIKEIQRIYDL